ncbi:threonylcarbamoyl-AMP synthase [Candidatus Dojkabacteria bacterium]|nr:threonylcarbamoyl-AMP synthase [Candidatus Dojkabacteria bacterium]
MEIIDTKDNLIGLDLKKVVEILRSGGLVIYPTDTAYGLGVLVSSKKGVDKLFEYKGARRGKAVSVAVAARKMAENYVEMNTAAEKLYEDYLPGAVTVVSKVREGKIGNDSGQVDKRLASENQTLGIRIPDSEIVKQITEALGEGVTSTSANVSGGKTPYSVEMLLDSLPVEKRALIDLAIDAGELPKVDTSTIVDTTTVPMAILRGELPKVWRSDSEEETYAVAAEILKQVEEKNSDKPVVLLLTGEMGAGKTQFVKGLAKAMGVADTVISPTFVLERQYGNLYHYDLWRVKSKEESRAGEFVENLGIENALKPGNIIAIEWPENIFGLKNYLKNMDAIIFEVQIKIDGKKRIISLMPS